MLKFWALWTLVYVLGRLPARVLYLAGGAVGTVAWYVRPVVREPTRSHMRHVLGPSASARDVDRAARACSHSAAYYYADFARYAHLPPERTFEAVDSLTGVEALFERLDRGCGVIFVSGHIGNPEFIMQALGPFDFSTMVFTEPLEPPAVHELVHRIRRRTGVAFLPADLQGLRRAIQQLRSGGVVAVMSDRDVLGRGRRFEFFGESAHLPTGAVELARRTNASIIFGTVLRTRPGHYDIALEHLELPPVTGNRAADLDSGMRVLIAALERGIRRAPEQWFALSPIWPLDGSSERGR